MAESKKTWMQAKAGVSLPVRVAQGVVSIRLADGEPVACDERQARLLERRGLAERVEAPQGARADAAAPKASKRKEDK